MARRVSLNNLDAAIMDALEGYGEDVKGNLKAITRDVGKLGAQALKSESSAKFGTSKKRKRKYAKTWSYKVDDNRLGTGAVIYNRQPGLPHLLEYGHVGRNGKRTFASVPGREHIRPVEEKLVETYISEVVSRL